MANKKLLVLLDNHGASLAIILFKYKHLQRIKKGY
jgi:hypothetical protein